MNPENNKSLIINALLDDGSTTTIIKQDIFNILKLPRSEINFKMTGVGNSSKIYKALKGQIIIESLDYADVKKFQGKITVIGITTPVGNLKIINWNKYRQYWNHLKDITFPDIYNDSVDLLIGGIHADLIKSLIPDISGLSGEPVARLTPLGWCVHGKVLPNSPEIIKKYFNDFSNIIFENYNPQSERIYSLSSMEKSRILDYDLKELVEKQWQIECLPGENDKTMSKEDRYAVKLFNDYTIQLPDGRYQCPVFWKPGEPQLPNNYISAESFHYSFHGGKNLKNPLILKEYNNQIDMWLNNNYVRKVPSEECRPRFAFYLPIFTVVDMSRQSTKARIVANCKAKFNNKSLNDAVLSGPCLIQDVSLTLTSFRESNKAFLGDLTQMFLRVWMRPEDRVYHRFLHSPTLGGPPQEMEFLVHCFGNAGSPAIAISVLRHHAEKNKQKYPLAYPLIMDSTHVDDILGSFDTTEKAIVAAKELKALTSSCGMHLTKFAANDEDIMKTIDQKDWSKEYNIIGENQLINMPTKKVLGLLWNSERDVFTFPDKHPINKLPNSKHLTKRHILGEYSNIYLYLESNIT
jgi:hypothetical protein